MTRSFPEAGIYRVSLTLEDSCEGNDGAYADQIDGADVYVIVFDPSEGFVTGGGWIHSPQGAYKPDPSLEGTASFAFLSKYKKGANVPDGDTEFIFAAGDLAFASTSYEWLVVTDHKAIYKGIGQINEAGTYGFQLSVIDAELTSSTDVDRFRMKIWEIDGNVIYDNQVGGDTSPDADPTTGIGSGNIKIHKKKGKK